MAVKSQSNSETKKTRKPKVIKFNQLDYEVESRISEVERPLYDLVKLECKRTTALIKQIYDYGLDMNLVEPNWRKNQNIINSQNREEYQVQLLRPHMDPTTKRRQTILIKKPIGKIEKELWIRLMNGQHMLQGVNRNIVTKPFYKYADEYVTKHITDTTGAVSKLSTKREKEDYLTLKYVYMSFPFELLTRYIESESFTLEKYVYDVICELDMDDFRCNYRYRGFRDNVYKYYLEHDFRVPKLEQSLWGTIHNIIVTIKDEKKLESLRSKAQLFSEKHWDMDRTMELHIVARCYMVRANDTQNIIPRLCEILSSGSDKETMRKRTSIVKAFMVPREQDVYANLVKVISGDMLNNARELRDIYKFINLTDVTDEQLVGVSKLDIAKINYAIKLDALEYKEKTGENFADHVASTAPLPWFKYLWA